MRRLMLAALVVAFALLAWLRVADRARDPRERRGATEAEHRRDAPSVADTEATEAGARSAPAAARLEGTVSGRYGGIWGVRVAALDGGTERVLAETYTDVDGRYALELEPGAFVDVLAEPAGETKLPSQRRDGVTVPATVDIGFEEKTEATGHVLCEGRARFRRVYAMAVPEAGHVAQAQPWELRAAARAPVLLAGESGSFEFTGLRAGTYHLVLDSERWMLREPVRFAADEKDIRAVAVRAFGVRLRVEDAALEIPVARFKVDVRFDARTLLSWEGRDGLLRTRVAHPMPPEWAPASGTDETFLEVTSPGYLPERLPLGHAGLVRLRPTRDMNVFLRVRYEDGTDCTEPLRADARRRGTAPFGLGFEWAPDGRRRASLPPGSWTVSLWRKDVLMPERQWLAVEVPPDGEVEREVTLARTGTLILCGAARGAALLTRIDGDRVRGSMVVATAASGQEFRLPQGRYRVSSATAMRSARRPVEFELKAGERIRVDVPADDR